MSAYTPASNRYETMPYRRCGCSGIKLPALSLGLWHNFGDVDDFQTASDMILHAFDSGITHFDLANNYGPSPGSAESNFGKILKNNLTSHRDELLISTKAGYLMWEGPYGEWGSRKNLLASLDQSLQRMGIDYVDIFYSHRYDPHTPLEETMGALHQAVHSGKALYAGISSYRPEVAAAAIQILQELGTPCLIHQPNYNMFDRWIEEGLLDLLKKKGIGSIVFSPLAQGQLTERYLKGIPKDSRADKAHGFLKKDTVDSNLEKIKKLAPLAKERNQTLAQMALAWTLRLPDITSALIGASSTQQLDENLACLKNTDFSKDELNAIDKILGE
ncbi:MAG: aldo/keto reductase [Chthoniobacterales bacterium]